MSCPPGNCGDAPVAGAGQFVTNTAQRTCTGATFCDSRLEGLPFANQLDLVGVPEGDQCLHRLNAPAGTWQHDPMRPGGADFVGPLTNVSFVPGPNLSLTECGYQPALRVKPDGTVELVKQDVTLRPDGELAIINTCPGGTQRIDILNPNAFDDNNPCEQNLSLLGWVNQAVIVNGQNALRKVWKQVTRLLFPATQLTSFATIDYTDGVNWRRAAWKKVGGCWELGLGEADEAITDTCADFASTGSTFPYLLACKDGATHKVEPTAGMSLVGDGTNWQMRAAGGTIIPRTLIGQRREGYTAGPAIVGLTDIPVPTSGQTTGTYNMTGIAGYVAGSRKVKLRCVTMVASLGSVGADPVAQISVNNSVVLESWIDSAHGFGYVNTVYVEGELTSDSFIFHIQCAVGNVVTGAAFAKLEVVGWE